MDADLADKCVLITGASDGLALAAARVFADEGVNLALHYYPSARTLST